MEKYVVNAWTYGMTWNTCTTLADNSTTCIMYGIMTQDWHMPAVKDMFRTAPLGDMRLWRGSALLYMNKTGEHVLKSISHGLSYSMTLAKGTAVSFAGITVIRSLMPVFWVQPSYSTDAFLVPLWCLTRSLCDWIRTILALDLKELCICLASS
jgi:hypothetical protein